MPHGPALDLSLKSANLPLMPVTLSSVQDRTQRGVEMTTKGDFQAAMKQFRSVLQSVPLMAISDPADAKTLQTLVLKIVEYITAMRIELERKRLTAANADPIR